MAPRPPLLKAKVAALPARDGIPASRVYLPAGSWATLLDFLIERFPRIEPAILVQRLEKGEIVDTEGTPQRADSPYRPGRWLWYYREVPDEVSVPFDLPVLYRDERIIAVDKPHFMATTPGGRYLRHTALVRLRKELDLAELAPMHRLDRDTAGVLVFSIQPRYRGAYQTLFQSRVPSTKNTRQWPNRSKTSCFLRCTAAAYKRFPAASSWKK